MKHRAAALLLALASAAVAADGSMESLAERARSAENARVETIERVGPAVVCIFDEGELGGGSGVLIDENGYGITNFHVVADMLETRKGKAGLSDGRLYDLQVLGIDPGGDVAMFKLAGDQVFPHAPLGDARTLRVGEPVLAMGNPFVLSDDYTPTVTLGIVSGVNRYQYGEGADGALLYSDCIQVDASINPGNSGGPLFNLAGQVIGINGRISVSMRGRVNVGLGYAITANQIKSFLPALWAGLLAEHGTLQAVVRDLPDGVRFVELMEDAPAWKLGARPGDELLKLDGREIRSANEFASILGTLPANWPVWLQFRSKSGEIKSGIVRTEAIRMEKIEERFEPDDALNLAAVERVIRRFQARLRDKEAGDNARVRLFGETMTVVEGGAVKPGEYTLKQPEGGSMLFVGADASFKATADAAENTSASSPAPLPPLEGLAWRALTMANAAASADTREQMSSWKHRGADQLLTVGSNGAILDDEVLESIAVPLGDSAEALLQFALDTHRLRRIRAIDAPTGDEVELHFADADRPDRVEARAADLHLAIQLRPDAASAPQVAADSPAAPALDAETAALVVRAQERVVKLVGAKIGRAEGYGSGVLISTDGLVLTVDSGLLEASTTRAVLSDGTMRNVDIVHTDRAQQLALLKLRPFDASEAMPRFPSFDINADATPALGDRVLAAGNPFKVAAGAEPVSLAQGVYCGTTRLDATRGTQEFPYRGEVLVIDAITSTPGFAGGALINARGEFLGLIGRAVESRGTHTNINYAIPRSVLVDFVAASAPGASPQPEPDPRAAAAAVYHGIKFFELGYRSNPVYVERVRRDSPAARAGVKKDDLIIGANNTQIASLAALERVIAACKPGDTLELTVLRGEKVQRLDVKLEAAP